MTDEKMTPKEHKDAYYKKQYNDNPKWDALTDIKWESIQDDCHCENCGVKFYEKKHVEFHHPAYRGGSGSHQYKIKDIQALCSVCHRKSGYYLRKDGVELVVQCGKCKSVHLEEDGTGKRVSCKEKDCGWFILAGQNYNQADRVKSVFIGEISIVRATAQTKTQAKEVAPLNAATPRLTAIEMGHKYLCSSSHARNIAIENNVERIKKKHGTYYYNESQMDALLGRKPIETVQQTLTIEEDQAPCDECMTDSDKAPRKLMTIKDPRLRADAIDAWANS